MTENKIELRYIVGRLNSEGKVVEFHDYDNKNSAIHTFTSLVEATIESLFCIPPRENTIILYERTIDHSLEYEKRNKDERIGYFSSCKMNIPPKEFVSNGILWSFGSDDSKKETIECKTSWSFGANTKKEKNQDK